MVLAITTVASNGGQPLSVGQHDTNWGNTKTAVETLQAGGGGGGGAVTSVFNRVGAVTAAASDYAASQVAASAGGLRSGATVQAQLGELDTLLQGKADDGDPRLTDARELLAGSTLPNHRITEVLRSGAYTLVGLDSGIAQVFTSAVTCTVPSAATLGDGFVCEVWNDSGGNVVLDGPGSTNVTLSVGEVATIRVVNAKVRAVEGPSTLLS